MRRIIFSFSLLLVFAFAFSGIAQASNLVFYITGEKFKVKEAYLKDGSKAHIEPYGAYLKDHFPGAKGVDIYTKIESHSDYLYKKGENVDSNTGYNGSAPGYNGSAPGYPGPGGAWMGRFSVYNYNNYPGNQNSILTNPFTHGVAEYSMDIQQYGTWKNKTTLSTNVDFYYWNNANPADKHASWFILTDLHYKLGTMTAADGTDYHLYLEFNTNQLGPLIPGLQQLEGKVYEDALAALGLAAGTTLWGVYVPGDGVAREISFDIRGYANDPYAPAVPVPAAAWLMGTGVAGLIALRRRNKK